MTFTPRFAVYGAGLAAVLALTGCGGQDSSPKDEAAGPSTPGAPTSAAAQPSAAPSSSGGTGAGSKPRARTEETGLPEGFPVEQIPVIDGEDVSGSRGGAGDPYAYTVLLTAKSASASAVMKQVQSLLVGAGFTVEPGPSTKSISSATFKSTGYDVGVNVIRADGRTTVTYVVLQH